jgi:hypothetical protein
MWTGYKIDFFCAMYDKCKLIIINCYQIILFVTIMKDKCFRDDNGNFLLIMVSNSDYYLSFPLRRGNFLLKILLKIQNWIKMYANDCEIQKILAVIFVTM